MQKFIVISILSVLIFILSSAVERVQKSTGPPSCNAGEPPNNTNCTSCHNDGVVNTGSAQITFDLGEADSGYIPGKTYTITVSALKAGMKKAGFQTITLQDNDNKISPGVVTLTDVLRTQKLDKNTPHSGGCLDEERVWIEHTYKGVSSNTSGVSSWSYQWKAPSTNVGSVTFYLAALDANNDLAETGDHVYTRKKTIAGLPVGLSEPESHNSILIYPQPAKEQLSIQNIKSIPDKIILYSITGKIVKVWAHDELLFQHETIRLFTGNIQAGVYFLCLKNAVGVVTKKVLVH